MSRKCDWDFDFRKYEVLIFGFQWTAFRGISIWKEKESYNFNSKTFKSLEV